MIWRVVAAVAMTITSLVLFAPAPPASACSCVSGTPATAAEAADAVFVGTVTSVWQRNQRIGHEVAVEQVWKGELPARVHVTTNLPGMDSCAGPRVPPGKSYLWFATGDLNGLRTWLCSGSGVASPESVGAVTAALGQPHEPSAVLEDPPMTRVEGRYHDLYVALGISGGVLACAGIAYVVIRRRRAS